VLRYLKTLPHLTLSDVTVKDLGGDNYAIETVVENESYLPTYITKEAVTLKVVRPLVAEFFGDAQIISGKAREEIGHLQGFSGVNFRYGHVGPITTAHDPYAKRLSWIVKAKPGTQITVQVSGDRAGKVCKTVTL